MAKYCDWVMDKKAMKDLFVTSMKQCKGECRIYTTVDHVSSTGMTRHISAFVPVVRQSGDGTYYADIVCIAREKKVSGCGMDMAFSLAYEFFIDAFGNDPDMKYQEHLVQRCL